MNNYIKILLILFVLAGGIYTYTFISEPNEEVNSTIIKIDTIDEPINNLSFSDSLTVATWNLQIFGKSKASNETLINKYANIIKKYDLVFVQEIRDISNTSFSILCKQLPGYNCLISSRAGRTDSKEQYGLMYRNSIAILDWEDFNNDTYNQQFERPPVKVIINIPGTWEGQKIINNLTIWNIHIKPSAVAEELANLEDIVNTYSTPNKPELILGDLNADCDYFNNPTDRPFNYLFWNIADDADTTTGNSDCAYDRIITNFAVEDKGIDKNVTDDLSDHYLVWAKV